MNSIKDIPEDDLILVGEKMIGIVLMNAVNDSHGNPIQPLEFYRMHKVKSTGMLIIEPTGVNQKHEFVERIWKREGKLN